MTQLLTADEAAQIFKCTREQIYNLIKRRVLRGTRLFGDWRIPADDVERAIAKAINAPRRS